jgi:cysteine-rich repeat protein
LDLLVDLPAGVVFMSWSYSLLWDGSFQWYDIDNGDPVFVIKMTWTPTTTTTTTRTYEGTIIFKTTITSTASSLSTNVVAQILCYGIPVQQYTWSPTCSTSQNRQSGIETSQDTQRIIINLSSTTTTAWSTSAWTTTNNWWTIWTWVVCGNGILQGTEECDDWNRLTNDGCSASCNIEQWRRCLPTSPSQCWSYDCFTHGESFLETNIFWTCCGWLQELIVVPTSAVVTGVVKSYICYDPLIWQPVCDTRASPSWRRIPTTTASGSQLVLKDSCRAIYKDYYKDLVSQLQGPHTQCVFADIPYDQVNFGDIWSTKQKVAIETLRDACVVQWIGEDLDTYGPGRPIQRAELIKMVVKLLIIADWSSSTESIWVYSWWIQFFDVPPTFWGAWYIDEAVRRGLLSAWTNQWLITFFKPHASVTREEFISLVRRIDFWQLLSREEIETIIWKRATVTRAAAAEVLVKKFLAILQPYFYFQGDQEEYYWRLTEELRGKNYQEQYSIILWQIDKLEQQDEHGSPEWRDTNDLNPFWMQEFLRDVIY